MRMVVYGAGAIGGVIGGRCAQAGEDVVLIARGAHLDALRSDGLTIESPDDTSVVRVPAVASPAELGFGDADVVLLAMKSQDTLAALDALRSTAPAGIPIVCAQNGVANERSALRRFPNVYGMCVLCPATHLRPGVVQASSSPVSGLLDVGRWPAGTDSLSEELAARLSQSTFSSVSRPDIARWKWGKLLMNLGNAVEAVCGRDAGAVELAADVRAEGHACLAAAGIAAASEEEDAARRAGLLTARPIAGERRGGGSTWQSLARGLGTVETDYLTGEVVLLGRLHGVPTPLNAVLQQLAFQMAARHEPPGSRSVSEVRSMAGRLA